jgi:glucose-6-phosphate 1-dehydrogenase
MSARGSTRAGWPKVSSDPINLDHYSFKSAVRYLTMLRAWPQIEKLARTRRLERVEVDIFETGSPEGRWYPSALEDMASHLLVMLAYTKIGLENRCGEAPNSAQIVAKRQSFFQTLAQPLDYDLVQGRYRGFSGPSATYFAARIRLTSPNWADVPIVIRSGKRLRADIAVANIGFEDGRFLRVRVQPAPSLRLSTIYGNGAEVREVDQSLLADPDEPGPYARVLIELLRGEHAWFLTDVEAQIVREWLDALSQSALRRGLPLLPYDPGSFGPSHCDPGFI